VWLEPRRGSGNRLREVGAGDDAAGLFNPGQKSGRDAFGFVHSHIASYAAPRLCGEASCRQSKSRLTTRLKGIKLLIELASNFPTPHCNKLIVIIVINPEFSAITNKVRF
jgi:hypothetical protein